MDWRFKELRSRAVVYYIRWCPHAASAKPPNPTVNLEIRKSAKHHNALYSLPALNIRLGPSISQKYLF